MYRKQNQADWYMYKHHMHDIQITAGLLCSFHRYLEGKAQLLYPEPRDVFPCELLDSDMCRPPTSYL